jgi:hypothetical protein
VIHGHDKRILTYDGAPGRMKYPPQGGEPQLFDLKGDPDEKVNLATENPDLVKQLTALLDGWYVPSDRQVGKVAPTKKAPARAKRKPEPRKRTSRPGTNTDAVSHGVAVESSLGRKPA